MKKFALLIVLANLVAACDTTAPKLTPRNREGVRELPRVSASLQAEGPENKFDPRVDILFIVDNSLSMDKNIENVSRNIETFVRQLAKNDLVDFHIAFTYVHDRSVPQFCPHDSDRPDVKNYDDPGTLQPMVGLDPSLKRRFVTPQDDYATILRKTFTVDMIAKPFVPVTADPKKCAHGAENEESVTPLLGALENFSLASADGPNAGFRRRATKGSPAAKFVAIILSDAKDAKITDGLMSIDQVYDRLMVATESTAQDTNLRVFAVAVKPGSNQAVENGKGVVSYEGGDKCTPDPAFKIIPKAGEAPIWPPFRKIMPEDNPLAQLAVKTEDKGPGRIDQVLSICDKNYGKTLAIYGARISEDVLQNVQIVLKNPPQEFEPGSTDEFDKGLAVFIGEEMTPANRLAPDQWKREMIGSKYVVTILVNKIDWKAKKGQRIRVRYIPVDIASKDARRI